MKTKMLILTSLILMGTFSVFAQSKSESFKVYGNCGMCKSRIETAAKSVDGVSTAEWNQDTKMLSVAFDSTKTDMDKIQIAIVKVGHDTDMHKADNNVYESLPSCCHYDREAENGK